MADRESNRRSPHAAGSNVEQAGKAEAQHAARGNAGEADKNLTDLDDAQHPEDFGFDPNDPANVAARENAAQLRKEHVAALEREQEMYKQRGDDDRAKAVDASIKAFRDGDRGKTRTA